MWKTTSWFAGLVLAVGVISFGAPVLADWGPPEVAVQGILTNLVDEPIEGPVTLTFALYDGPDAEVALWMEQHQDVPLTMGRFDLLMGSSKPLDDPPLFEQFDDLWVGISVDGDGELPRAPLASVGYALQARHAVYCDQLSDAAGDINCEGCVGSQELADGGVAPVDLSDAGCSGGQVLKRNEANDAWVCADDSDSGYEEGDGIVFQEQAISIDASGCAAGWVLKRNEGNGAWVCAPDDNTGYEAGWGMSLADGKVSIDKTVTDTAYVEEDQENAISMEMLQEGSVTDAKVNDVGWNKLTGVPDGFADGIDNVGLLVEVDPGVGQVTNGSWCVGEGGLVSCTSSAPVLDEDDPEVGANTDGYIPRWDGTALVSGAMYDNGNIGIGNSNPGGRLHVSGGLVRMGVGGTANSADGDGDLYVQHDLEVDGGAYVGGTLSTGSLANSGKLTQSGDAEFSSDVEIDATLDMKTHKIEGVTTPTADTDATNKAYVDDAVSTAISNSSAAQSVKRQYAVLLGVRNKSHCPSGFTAEDVDTLKGADNYVFFTIATHGLFMGAMNSKSYGQEHLYGGFNVNNGMEYLCWKTYTAEAGKPHVNVLMPYEASKAVCPDDYEYLPASTLKGNNNNGYMMSNPSGLYLGYIDTWDRNSHEYSDHSGYAARNFTSHVGGVCFKVMGVEGDSDTATGVYPVILGLQSESQCPAGWNVETTSAMDGSNNTFYLQVNDNATIMGGTSSWWTGGNNKLQINFNYDHVNYVCWKHLPRDGQPFYHIRIPHTGNCGAGYTTLEAYALKGWNNNGYIAATGHGLYIGGLNGWDLHDYSEGKVQHNFTSYVNHKVCLKLENVVE